MSWDGPPAKPAPAGRGKPGLGSAKILPGSAGANMSTDVRVRYFEAAVNLMDDDLREEIHRELAPCTEQEFLDEYVKRHKEKFGEEFKV
jgi:hypothetical protein